MDELYKEYSKLVFNYLKSLSNDAQIAEELTQETFYRAIKNVNNFHGNCKVSTWLCQIAKNIYKNYYIKERKIQSMSLDDLYVKDISVDNNFDENINSKNELINLYKCIHNLDENTREVFYLRLKCDLSFKEIGEILNKNESWARTAFHRGKIKLKESLNNDKK